MKKIKRQALEPLLILLGTILVFGVIQWICAVVFSGRLLSAFAGVHPRELGTLLPGILFMPLLHGSIGHLISNAVALCFLVPPFFLSHENLKSGWQKMAILWLGTGFLLWCIGPPHTVHIGASGLVYALAGYLVVYGFRGGHWVALIAAIFVVLFQTASLIQGLLPTVPGISYSGHWCGLIVGAVVGFRASPRRGN